MQLPSKSNTPHQTLPDHRTLWHAHALPPAIQNRLLQFNIVQHYKSSNISSSKANEPCGKTGSQHRLLSLQTSSTFHQSSRQTTLVTHLLSHSFQNSTSHLQNPCHIISCLSSQSTITKNHYKTTTFFSFPPPTTKENRQQHLTACLPSFSPGHLELSSSCNPCFRQP